MITIPKEKQRSVKKMVVTQRGNDPLTRELHSNERQNSFNKMTATQTGSGHRKMIVTQNERQQSLKRLLDSEKQRSLTRWLLLMRSRNPSKDDCISKRATSVRKKMIVLATKASGW
jgi:hypothetical protein